MKRIAETSASEDETAAAGDDDDDEDDDDNDDEAMCGRRGTQWPTGDSTNGHPLFQVSFIPFHLTH